MVGEAKDRLGRSSSELSYLTRVEFEQQQLAREEARWDVRAGVKVFGSLALFAWAVAVAITHFV